MHVCYLKWSSLSFFVDWLSTNPRGGLLYETDGDARRLTSGCKFWILVSLRVFRPKRQYFKLPRPPLGFCKEAQNYAMRNRSQIFFLCLFFVFFLKRSLLGVKICVSRTQIGLL